MTELAEWDWVVARRGRRLHHLTTADDPVGFEDCCGTAGVASCGKRSDWWHIPGIFARMGAERCKRCCDALGYPHGTGSPKNDDACRPLVEARLAALAEEPGT